LHNPQAQSFKPLSTSLTRVELFFNKGEYPSFTIKVSIRNSLTGDDLTSKTIHVSQIPSGDNWIEFDFPDITVIPGETYYIIGEADEDYSDYLCWFLGKNNPYPQGQSWGFNSVYGGWYDTNYENRDFCFKTYGFGNHPPEAPKVWWSPKYPKAYDSINLTFNSVDPDGDNVYFHIEWPDGETDATGYIPSGINITISFTAGNNGTYYYNITAGDENGGMSETTTVKIIVGKSKAETNNNLLLLRILERFPLLQQLYSIWRSNVE
jgi:hypothetical protein